MHGMLVKKKLSTGKLGSVPVLRIIYPKELQIFKGEVQSIKEIQS
jgi:hypothetical protein